MKEGEIPALWISERKWDSWESAADLELKIPDVCKLLTVAFFERLITRRVCFLGKQFV